LGSFQAAVLDSLLNRRCTVALFKCPPPKRLGNSPYLYFFADGGRGTVGSLSSCLPRDTPLRPFFGRFGLFVFQPVRDLPLPYDEDQSDLNLKTRCGFFSLTFYAPLRFLLDTDSFCTRPASRNSFALVERDCCTVGSAFSLSRRFPSEAALQDLSLTEGFIISPTTRATWFQPYG